jgi:hypothetical protein
VRAPRSVKLSDVREVAAEKERLGRGRASNRLFACADEVERLRAGALKGSIRAALPPAISERGANPGSAGTPHPPPPTPVRRGR